jgi:glycosyltransferase involved in cell wall biosynthesis
MTALLLLSERLACGGAERHTVTLAAGLAARGARVTLSSLKSGAAFGEQLAQVPVACCHAQRGLARAPLHRLTSLLDATRPALLVATSQYALMYGALACRRAAQPVRLVFICHSTDVVRRGLRARLRFGVYRHLYDRAQCVVFVSEHQRAYFAAQGVRTKRSEVIYHGIDLAHFAPPAAAARAAMRRELGIAPHELVVGLCAVLREEKRHADLLAAVARLRAAGLPLKALLVGEGPMRAQIDACRARLGLAGALLLAGHQDDVRPWLGACDMVALTSHSETFPIATLEAMALGKPLVVSNVGGLGEQVTHGVNGLLYRAGDIDALAGALAHLADPAARTCMGQGALASAHARFALPAMLARYEALFAELAS